MAFRQTFWALILMIVTAPSSSWAMRSWNCLKAYQPTAAMRNVGVETVHLNSAGPVTVLLPMPLQYDRYIFDLNYYTFGFAFPKKFVISDGTLKTPFVSVDLSPSSLLNHCLDEMVEEIAKKTSGGRDIFEVLRTYVGGYLKPVEGDWQPSGVTLHFDSTLPIEFYSAAQMTPGHYPLPTMLSHPTVPLESYLFDRRGVCLQKVLFTSLLMQKLKLPHQVRAGGTGETGHMWVELPDGRYLDPTWQLLEKPTADRLMPGWFKFSRTILFRNQYFPFAVDEVE